MKRKTKNERFFLEHSKRYRISASGVRQKFTGNRWRRMCEHDLRPEQCKHCGGLQTCCHSSNRAMCPICNPNYHCKHRIFHQYCGMCGGSQACKQCNAKKQQCDGFCTTCHPDYVPTLSGVSKIACECLEQLQNELNIELQCTRIDKETKEIVRSEFRPPEMPRAPVDGYHADTRSIFEFLGNYWHGHPTLQTSDGAGNHFGRLHCESFAQTEAKFETLHKANYTVYYIWESDYVRYKKRRRKTKISDLWSVWRRFDGKLCS